MRPRRKISGLILGFCAVALLFSGTSIAKDIYLAVRQDGRGGSGSAQDPFDASTPDKHDQLLATYSYNTVFHYAAGTYQTRGWHYRTRNTAGANCKHYGSGMERTVIRLVGTNDPTHDGAIFGSDYHATADGFELQNLTLDCNAPGNSKFRDRIGAVSAVNVVRSNMLFSNLKVEKFDTGQREVECFPLLSFAGAVPRCHHGTNGQMAFRLPFEYDSIRG
jgi:hypothetical protein